MLRYKLFEKEITSGNHASYHFCVDKFDITKNHFHPKSKQYAIEKELSNIDIDLSPYECNITSSTTTSVGDYFHVSYLRKSPYEFLTKEVLDYFKINVDFPVLYFTRKIPYEKNFKCGFYLKTFKTFKSKFFNETVKIISLFDGLYYDVYTAGDFTFDGKFIDKSINIEIFPIQSKNNYYSIKKILLNNFDIEEKKINLYDKKFVDYSADKFFFYIKIKLTENGTIVKFYRTYPDNPFKEEYFKVISLRTLRYLSR